MQNSLWKKDPNDHPLVVSIKDALNYLVEAKSQSDVGVANKYLNSAVEELETAAQTEPRQFTRADSVSISHLIPPVDEKTRPDLLTFSERMYGVLASLSKTANVVSLTVIEKAITPKKETNGFDICFSEIFERVNPSVKPLRETRRSQLAHKGPAV